MTSSQPNLKDIMKEIITIRGKIDKLENIVEKRLIGEVKPDEYERKAIAEFEKKRRSGKLKFVTLPELEE